MDVDLVDRHWQRAGAALGFADAATWPAVGASAVDRHCEPHRHYHGVAHVAAVLRALERLVDGPVTPELVVAAVFHDAIYDPTSATNELDSARLAASELARVGVADGVVRRVVDVIEATAGHDPGGASGVVLELVHVFLDADLSILGASASVYDGYADAIRKEYAHVSDDDFRRGRSQILADFLARDRLFFTPVAHALWDQPARVNLSRELTALQGSDPQTTRGV